MSGCAYGAIISSSSPYVRERGLVACLGRLALAADRHAVITRYSSIIPALFLHCSVAMDTHEPSKAQERDDEQRRLDEAWAMLDRVEAVIKRCIEKCECL